MLTSQQTPLYDQHKAAGARMIDFGGWQMPVFYSSVLKEHEHVRQKAGVFDVSHMGELMVTGPEASAFLQYVTINDIHALDIGQGQYTGLLLESGGMIDDLICYRLGESSYLLCVNAANTEKDYEWLQKHVSRFKAELTNVSKDYGQIALQGPLSLEALQQLLPGIPELKYMEIRDFDFKGQRGYVARTGYTGERGVELYMPVSVTPALWDLLLTSPDIKPIGLGARDTLRLEACYLLYGQDMNEGVSPLEAGIGWATKVNKGDFIGREAVVQQKQSGLKRRLAAFVMEDKGIPRPDMKIYIDDVEVGTVTSGSTLPSLSKEGGLALLDVAQATVDQKIEIDIRGKRKLARVVKRPLYSAKVK